MKKKRRIANFIMAAIIALIAAAGLFAVGSVRGWFGGGQDAATLCDVRGVVTLTRAGVSYPELLDELIDLALKREREREGLSFSYDTNLLSENSLKGLKGLKGAKR